MKRLVVFVLAVTLSFSLAVTSYADGELPPVYLYPSSVDWATAGSSIAPSKSGSSVVYAVVNKAAGVTAAGGGNRTANHVFIVNLAEPVDLSGLKYFNFSVPSTSWSVPNRSKTVTFENSLISVALYDGNTRIGTSGNRGPYVNSSKVNGMNAVSLWLGSSFDGKDISSVTKIEITISSKTRLWTSKTVKPNITTSICAFAFASSTYEGTWAYGGPPGMTADQKSAEIDELKQAVSALQKNVANLQSQVNGIGSTITTAVGSLGDKLTQVINTASQTIVNRMDSSLNILKPLISGIQSTIEGQTNIMIDLMTKGFPGLETAIKEQTTQITDKLGETTDAIENQTGILDNAFNSDLTDSSVTSGMDNINSLVQQQDKIHNDIYLQFAEANMSVSPETFQFPQTLLTGMQFVSLQLTVFYNALGEYQYLISFPLLLGIALVFVGRKGKSK